MYRSVCVSGKDSKGRSRGYRKSNASAEIYILQINVLKGNGGYKKYILRQIKIIMLTNSVHLLLL